MENRGRKKIEDPDDVIKPVSIGLSKRNKEYLVNKFGSLNNAIKSLLQNDSPAEIEKPKPPASKPQPKKVKSAEPTMAELWAKMNKK